MEPFSGRRGRYYTVDDWVSALRRMGTWVPGGEGFESGVTFVALQTQDHGAVVLDVAGGMGLGVMVFVEMVRVVVVV